ncbi:MAG TPA: amidohydrolase [Mycobacteriales bacterium]|nr:amidohydrolase [Mycobacteriales bacterium]
MTRFHAPTRDAPAGWDLQRELDRRLAGLEPALIELRRDLHAHPELAWAEVRTSRVVRDRLTAAGLTPRVLPSGTGVVCDVGAGEPLVALRADLDALPVRDEKDVAYRSTVPGLCHACGHDVHTVIVLGAGVVLAELAAAGTVPGRVRLVFQPAEEATPGGALDVLAADALAGVRRIFAVHCDPQTVVGTVGLRVGAITAASDHVCVRLSGPGGHTARPHLTGDLVYALGKVITELPAALTRRLDPRAAVALVWGRVAAGSAPNAIPDTGLAEGTVRTLDTETWAQLPELVTEIARATAAPYAVNCEVAYRRGVPPVVNEPVSTELLRATATEIVGVDNIVNAEQSLGGEDFGWYLEHVPGALARLGVAVPGDAPASGAPARGRDLHQGTFDVDERAIGLGVRLLTGAAISALHLERGDRPPRLAARP